MVTLDPQKYMLVVLSGFSRLASVLLMLLVFVFLWASFKRGELPKPSQILPALLEMPEQTPIKRKQFSFPYFDKVYVIQPIADYQIQGVVVSHNNPAGFGDIYHDETSVDIRDLCMVYGNNLRSENYRKVSYWSESWTCNWRAKDQDVFNSFRMDGLSNNHLLSSDAAVRKTILKTHIGDQVRLRGMLVNYWEEGQPQFVRQTSTVRSDTGNGACEVVFVTGVEILKSSTPIWNLLYERSGILLLVLIVTKLLLFVGLPFLEYKWG